MGDQTFRTRAAKKSSKSIKGTSASRAPNRPAKLYWCTTPDHDEDWFVIARSALSARRYHEKEEGYAPGAATAESVCDVPARFADDAPCWPSDAAIEACGGEILKRGVRAVRIAGRVFGEGDTFENAAVEVGVVRRH